MRYLILIVLCVLQYGLSYSQTISWGPSSPAVQSRNINTCGGQASMTYEFTNTDILLNDVTVEVQMDTGVYYVPGAFTFTTSGSIVITELDISDLSRPVFSVGSMSPGDQVNMVIDRTADCEAMTLQIAGSTFIDSVHVYESGVETTYANGISNGAVNYDILYGLLSVTGIVNSPPTINLGNSSDRSAIITNGAFGPIDEFYFAEVFTAGELDLADFRINPNGINYAIPAGNISISGDSVIVHFTAAELQAIDGSGGTTGDGDGLFEQDEFFELSYTVSPNFCGTSNTVASELLAWFGCSYNDRCQMAQTITNIGLNNTTPIIDLSDADRPRLDFCETVTYSVTLTNNSPETSPPGGAYAKDVTAILGLRANNTPIATLADNQQWGSERFDVRHFVDHTLNGVPVTLPYTPGRFGSTIPHLPPDYFDTDPDGPGGLDDIDGDGYYDDLAKDAVLVIGYGAYLLPEDGTCGAVSRSNYVPWEHISADISWFNQCGELMSPLRQEFNYTSHIRNYNTTSFTDAPTDVLDGDNFNVGIRPYIRSTIDCNGDDGKVGASMDWITQIVLPDGITMASGFDASVYDVTGNIVTTTDKYEYNWTYFPLTFDCSAHDGSDLISFPISTYYICKNGLDTCYQEEVHCFDIEIVPQCISGCTGVSITSFTTKRVSESWVDNTKTSLVDLDNPSIVEDYVFPYDTVAFIAEGVINDTLSDELFLRVKYSPEDGTDIFSFEDGTIEIVDIDGQYGGQSNYTTPLTISPVVTSLGGNDYELIFDLSSYRTSVNNNYSYGQSSGPPGSYDSDSIKVNANMVITNTMGRGTSYTVDSLRAEFYILDNAGDEVLCNSLGSSLSYEYPFVRAGHTVNISSGCGQIRKHFYLVHVSNTGDNHPNEYRPSFHLDSVVIDIPLGWTAHDAYWIDNILMDPSDYELRADGSLILRRPSYYIDIDKRGTASLSFEVDLTADCRVANGTNTIPFSVYYKNYAYLTDQSSHQSSVTSSAVNGIDYSGPTFAINPINQTAVALSDTVSWQVRICNTTSDMDVGYNWLTLDGQSNQIIIDSVVDRSTSNSLLVSTLPSGESYLELGSIDQGACTDVVIYSTYTSCTPDTLSLSHGWSCFDYLPLDEVESCGAENEVYIQPQSAQINASITSLSVTPTNPSNPGAGDWGSSTVDICNAFPTELTVVNSQPGNLFNTSIRIKIPSSGSGTLYIPNSATIEVEGIDAIDSPRPIGAAAEGALITASSNGDLYWTVQLSDLDPTNFGSGQPLLGTSNSAQNEFKLRWEMEATCDIVSGDFIKVNVRGNDPCGSLASGSSEQVTGFPININGAAPPYASFLTPVISPSVDFEGCNDTKTVNLDILISGGTTGISDTLEVSLPDGMTYGGGYVCTTPGNCPTYISTSIIDGSTTILFAYPSGVAGNIEMSFDLVASTRGDCFLSQPIRFTNKAFIGGLACGGSTCPSLGVITGDEEVLVNMEKPELTITYNSLTVIRGQTTNLYTYDLDISNAGLATDSDIIIEFYCLNTAGDDILGTSVARDTLTTILANGSIEVLNGEFRSTCDPQDGIAVLIVPEYDNCYCTSLESMIDKSAGLLEIPNDTLTNIQPLACGQAITNPHLRFIVNRKID